MLYKFCNKILTFIIMMSLAMPLWADASYYYGPDKLFFNNVSYYKKPVFGHNIYVLNSNYNYVNVAHSITKGCNTDYEKICAIYKWICDNIEYDTSYEIHDADNCFKYKRGVCQAYCNLFYYIAKSIGIRVEVINGKSKDFNGRIGSSGHAWIFAYTHENYGILIDPTWGAGSVNGNTFVKNENCWIWFNIDPKWMILSHFPDDDSYQLLENKISLQKFYSMKPVNSIWIEYGLNLDDIYDKVIGDQLEMPEFYTANEGKIELLDMPMQESVKIGQFYYFRVKMLKDSNLAIINDDMFITKEEWQYEGDGIYSINFMPRNYDDVTVSVKEDYEDTWWSVFKYSMDYPTQNDWNNLRNYYPLESPEMANVKNLYVKEWKAADIDEFRLYQLIVNNNVKELPVFYTNMGENLKIVSVPMTNKLKKGNAYTFSFYPQKGETWAVINEGAWYTDWNVSSDGMLTITVRPENYGKLNISVLKDDGLYHACLGYKITD